MIVLYLLLLKSKKLSKTLLLRIFYAVYLFSCRLLSVVAIQPVIRVVDVTHTTSGEVAESGSVIGDVANDDGSVGHQSITSAAKTMVALPKFLAQYELRIPTEDKDIYTYYYLLNVSDLLPFPLWLLSQLLFLIE